MQPTTNTDALILPQYQPHLPGEMPHAYLVRTGDTEHEYDHHQDMYDALIVDQLGCITRRDAAMRLYRGCTATKIDGVVIGKTDLEVNVVAFHDGHMVTIRPSQFDWSEREVMECEVEAVYDASTWEDVTKLVDLESLAEQIQERLRDRDAAEREDAFDARAERLRNEQD